MTLAAPWLLLLPACKKPPEAPQELEDLCSYLFEHAQDEDPAELEAGVANLATWLEGGTAELSEGYTVKQLSQGALDSLDDGERSADGILGAAISTETSLDMEPVMDALTLGDQVEIYPDTYAKFERSFDDDPACFLGHDCATLAYTNEATATLPLGIEIDTHHRSQDRWADWEGGPVHVHRAWLLEPAESDLLHLNTQYFLVVSYPWDGGLLRVQALWATAEIVGANVPQATLLNMLVTNLKETDEELFEYIQAH